MLLLLGFAFLAGIVTVLSPCILPLLPIILSSTTDASGKQRPLGVVTGFVLSFTFFTLFLSTIVRLSGIPADSLRFISIFVLGIFGASLLIPAIQAKLEIVFSKLASLVPSGQKRTGFFGGLIIGLSLGLLWTPCVGPILASVISLALTGVVSAQAFLITLAYALGTALPMLIIMIAGSSALQKVPWLVRNTGRIQKAFGVLMILTAVGIFFNIDRSFQTFILRTFPNYGVGLTQFEENQQVKIQLQQINQESTESEKIGKPMFDFTQLNKVVAPELLPGGQWFNSDPLTISELKGKVVLVDFWTYSCINCIRTMPYLRDWWQKYESEGLVIIGVHAPEFEFEKSAANVQQAISDFELTYPIMQDNDFATWRAYQNQYWPAKYLIDKDGYIRYTHFGEGDYDETEQKIQELLKEAGSTESAKTISNPTYQVKTRTPELYLGYHRMSNFVSPERITPDAATLFSAPKNLSGNTFAYTGSWTITPEYSAPSKNSKLLLNFEAQEVFLVARSKIANKTALLKVFVDDMPQHFGEDAPSGIVTVDTDRLYKLVKLDEPGKHLLKLEFQDDNMEVYAFTFG